jgi:hypothetical protein
MRKRGRSPGSSYEAALPIHARERDPKARPWRMDLRDDVLIERFHFPAREKGERQRIFERQRKGKFRLRAGHEESNGPEGEGCHDGRCGYRKNPGPNDLFGHAPAHSGKA